MKITRVLIAILFERAGRRGSSSMPATCANCKNDGVIDPGETSVMHTRVVKRKSYLQPLSVCELDLHARGKYARG